MAGLDGTDTSTTVYIDDLNPLNPDKDDPKSQGDDHIRFVKRVLKNTFPNITGPITATETELNFVDGVTSAIQTQLANLIPSGTVMLFVQASAPTGWTRVDTHNDKTLRIVNTTGGGSGGNVAFSTVFGKTATDAHTLTTTEIPVHAHSVNINTGYVSSDHVHTLPCVNGGTMGSYSGFVYETFSEDRADQTSYGISANHYHNVSGNTANAGSGGSHTHNLDIRVHYVDALICTKNA